MSLTDEEITALEVELRDPDYAGALQHCRSYVEIDSLFGQAADTIAQLKRERDEAKQAAALEYAERQKAIAVAREAMKENKRAAEYFDRADTAEAELKALRSRLSENNRWPDPLQSPQAQAIRAGKIDMTEIADLFDKVAREIEFHRAAASENASLRERLEKAEWKAHAGSLSHDEEIATLTARLEALEAALRDLCDWVEHDVGVELPFDARAVLSTNSEKEAGRDADR